MLSLLRSSRKADFQKFAKFIAVGLLNTIFGYSIFAALTATGFGPEISALLSTFAGVMFNYWTTGRLVFSNKGYLALPKFIGVYAAICTLNVISLRTLISAGLSALAAQALLLPLITIASYFAISVLVFGKKKQ